MHRMNKPYNAIQILMVDLPQFRRIRENWTNYGLIQVRMGLTHHDARTDLVEIMSEYQKRIDSTTFTQRCHS